jgi:hypothetical protein
MKQETKNTSPFFISFIFPFLGLILGGINIIKTSSHVLILFFAFWFGFSIMELEGADHMHYFNTYPEVRNYTFNDFAYLVTHSLSSEKLNVYEENVVNGKPDFFALTVMYLTTRIFEDPRWFFGFIGLIYYYFLLKFKEELIKYTGIDSSGPWKTFFVFILFLLPIHVGITGVRFWTALFLLLWILMKYLNTKKGIYLYLIWLTTIIHYTFAVPCLFLTIFSRTNIPQRLIKPLSIGFLFLFYLSSSTGILQIITDALSIFNDTSIGDSAMAYTDTEALELRDADIKGTNWYVTLRELLTNNSLIIIYFLEVFGFLKYYEEAENEKLRTYTFIFLCISLMSANLGSIGRFNYLFSFFMLIRLMKQTAMKVNVPQLKLINNFMLPILILHLLVSFRSALYTVDPVLLVGNPIVFINYHSPISLSELIVGH